jgi:hypothetical protein
MRMAFQLFFNIGGYERCEPRLASSLPIKRLTDKAIAHH